MKPALLEATNLGKVFGRFTALRDVTARFEEGQLTAIIGPNGAGKSTFFNLLTGAFAPSSGSIRFAGEDITGMPQYRFARMGIAKSFQITNVFPRLDALENVRLAVQMRSTRLDFLGARAKRLELEAEAQTLLDRVGLHSHSKKLARDLAHGQQRSLEIAMALACRPRLLLMDEPTAGMSPEETRTMMDLISELATERTIVLVEHKMKLVLGLCQRLLVLHHGEFLAEGTPTEIRANPEVRRVLSGTKRMTATASLFQLDDLHAWYDRSHVVQGVSMHVDEGEIVTLMGRNGAGKTTTLRSIMGLVDKCQGQLHFAGESMLQLPAHLRYHAGIAFVPEDRRIVAGLSVLENLKLGMLAAKRKTDQTVRIAEIAATFPRLAERLHQEASSMSGGEQQMLAIARALMVAPRMLLLDEPSEGIMPVLVDEMFELFSRLRDQGMTILLVEQNVERALSIANRAYILDQGMIVHQATAREMLADPAIQEKYCAV